MDDPLLGRTIGGVAIDAKLGAGGMGSVYVGKDSEAQGERRAIKLLSVTQHEAYRLRFQREARIGNSLDHPLLVRVHRFGTSGDYDFMVQDFVEGEDLANVMQRMGPMPWGVVAALGRDMARALAALHARGVVHRDLKPANVLLDGNGGLKLADFGLARWQEAPPALQTEAPLTHTGDAFGTPLYMAPEQFVDTKSAGPPADLYALGVLLFQALTGRPPFSASTTHALARLHSEVLPPSLEAQAADAPAMMRELIAALLAKAPEDRPGDVEDLAHRFAVLAQQSSAQPIPIEAPPGSLTEVWDPQKTAPGRPKATPTGGGTSLTPAAGSRGNPALILGLLLLLAVGVGAAWQSPHVRKQLASREEQDRYQAILDAMHDLDEDTAPLLRALENYRRDFDTQRAQGWLHEDVHALRFTPLRVRQSLFIHPADGAEMVYVPADSYRIGHPQGDEDPALSPPRQPLIAGYLIDREEVSNARYERFLAEWRAAGAVHRCGNDQATHEPDPKARTASPDPAGPVVGVSPYDALEYALFYGRRLPSEDEWEVAASWDPVAAESGLYAWSGDLEPSAENRFFANLSFAGFGQLDEDGEWQALCSPSGAFRFDRSHLGLIDMGGNAAEWCAGLPLPGKQPIRGGSIEVADPKQALVSYLRTCDPAQRPSLSVGFRTVMPFAGP